MSDSRGNVESKQGINIPFSQLPKKIQEYLVLERLIFEKDWDSYQRDKQQVILNEYDLQKTVNEARAREQNSAANSKNNSQLESKSVSNILNTPFRFNLLPKEIQRYLIAEKKILEKYWNNGTREKQQKMLDDYTSRSLTSLGKTVKVDAALLSDPLTVRLVFLLKDLPSDILLNCIFPYFFNEKTKEIQMDLKTRHGLVQVCKVSHFLFQPVMNETKKAKLKELFEAVLCPEVDPERKIDRITDIRNMLEKHPNLLLEELDEKECSAIRGPSGHSAAPTLYRTALATEDTQLAEMIKAELIKVGGEKAADEQYAAQFPKRWEAKEEERWAPIFKQLEVMTEAIRYAAPHDIVSSGHPEYKLEVKPESNVDIALVQFRSMLDATLNDAATTGRHFNPNFLLKAFQLYDDHYRDYFGNNWDDPRAMAFWQLVIGYIERFMPVNYIQAFFDGLNTSEEKLRKGTPQGRSLKFEVFDGGLNRWVRADFYPLSKSCLGFNFGIYAAGGSRGCAGPPTLASFEAYVNQKLSIMKRVTKLKRVFLSTA